MRQATIYRQPGRFAGWPANYGIWHWDDEIVVGFTIGAHKTVERGHARDKDHPFVNVQARSLDGGETWRVEAFNGALPSGRGLSADEHMAAGLRLAEVMDDASVMMPSEPLNFEQDDFALMAARTGLSRGVRSFFYVSYDRCHSWAGPYRLPLLGQTGIAARSDYLILSEHSALLFLTANKTDGREGKIICVRTLDGGMSFELLSEVGDEPREASDFAIMPASLRLPSGRLICARRCRHGASGKSWIDLYVSDDQGYSWQYLNQSAQFQEAGHSGNPPCLQQLPDGRLLLLYGNRDHPYAICARISVDEGNSWGDEIILRSGGANGDIGYVRAAVLESSRVVAVYYFNDQPGGDGERFIEATIWQPKAIQS